MKWLAFWIFGFALSMVIMGCLNRDATLPHFSLLVRVLCSVFNATVVTILKGTKQWQRNGPRNP